MKFECCIYVNLMFGIFELIYVCVGRYTGHVLPEKANDNCSLSGPVSNCKWTPVKMDPRANGPGVHLPLWNLDQGVQIQSW